MLCAKPGRQSARRFLVIEFRRADVFAELRKLRDSGARFDLIILDPPKFAPTAAQVKKAARALQKTSTSGH